MSVASASKALKAFSAKGLLSYLQSLGVEVVGGSNPLAPTNSKTPKSPVTRAFLLVIRLEIRLP